MLPAESSRARAGVAPFEAELFGALVEQSLVGTFVVENEHIVYANPRAAEIFGRPIDALLGLKLDLVVHPDDRKDGNQRLRERAAGGAPSAPYSIRGLRPDGTIRELETQSTVCTIAGRHVVVISILDFTERNRTQRVLNQMADAVGSKVGEQFFASLVLNLSRTLGVDYAFVAEIVPDGKSLQMIAVAVDGRIADPITYLMADTPCERVVGSSLCWFPSDIQRLFPKDHLLLEMHAESYAGVPLHDPAGSPLGLLAIIHRTPLSRERAAEAALEIYAVRAAAELERRRSDRALRAAKSDVDNLIETAPVLILELDRAGIILRVNEAVEFLTALRRDDLVGRFASELFPGVALTVAPTIAESVVRRGDEERFVAWRNREIHDPSNTVTGTFVFGADVTEQRKLQRDVQRSAAEWKETFDNVNTPILVTDADGLIMRANRAACLLAGIGEGDIVGRVVDAIGDDEPWQTSIQLIRHVVSLKRGTSAECKDRSDRTWDLTIAHFSASLDDEPRFILVLWDISGIVELQESLSRAATMSAMGSLVAGVAHEVRNPLFGISATLDAYDEELSRPDYTECAAALRTEVEHLKRLMQELLDYGKPAALQIERSQIGGVIDEAISGRAYADSGVQVVSAYSPGLPDLLMDRGRMRQVFENLIDNAVQLSPRGARVTIAASETEQSGRRWVECRVEDSGPGFSSEDLDRAFEPFFSRRRGGTGLGLPIVQRIVEEHAGKVFAGNRAVGGAIITVRLPAAEGS